MEMNCSDILPFVFLKMFDDPFSRHYICHAIKAHKMCCFSLVYHALTLLTVLVFNGTCSFNMLVF